MLKTALTVLATLLLGGCATNYVAPDGAATAMVKFTTTGIGSNNNAYFLMVKPGPGCKNTVGQSLAKLGAAIDRDGVEEYERRVESGNDIRLFSQWLQSYSPYGYSSCTVSAGVALEPGHRYEMQLNTSNPCSLHLYEVGSSASAPTPIELPIRSYAVKSSKQLCDL